MFDAGDNQSHGGETVVMMEGMKRLEGEACCICNSANALLILFVDLIWHRARLYSPCERLKT
jgi:hypothetical protein